MRVYETDTAPTLPRLIGGLYPEGYIHLHGKDQDNTRVWSVAQVADASNSLKSVESNAPHGMRQLRRLLPGRRRRSESRIHYGPGYRLYFLRCGEATHVLLLGGNKANQTADIRKAQTLAKKIKKGGAS